MSESQIKIIFPGFLKKQWEFRRKNILHNTEKKSFPGDGIPDSNPAALSKILQRHLAPLLQSLGLQSMPNGRQA